MNTEGLEATESELKTELQQAYASVSQTKPGIATPRGKC